MQITEYTNIFNREETHFFYKSTHFLILELIKKFLPHARRIKILDAGCGTGGLAVLLRSFGRVEAIDLSTAAVRYAKQRGIHAKKGSIMRLPFHSQTFGLVTCVDVLYHQKVNDEKALKELCRVLRNKGYLIIRVPANPIFATSHDAFVHARQRYTQNELQQKLVSAGFSVKYISAVHTLLVPFVLIKKLQECVSSPAPHTAVRDVNTYINTVLSALLMLEAKILQIHPLPFGVGLIAVCQKRS